MKTAPAPDVWGKNPATAYPLAAHLLDTALVIGALWDSWLRPGLRGQITDAIAPGDPAAARRLVTLVAALHDVGKANPLFQFQDSDSRHLAWREGLAASLDSVGLAGTPAHVVSHARINWNSPARRHEYVGFRAVAGEHPKQATNDFVRAQWLAVVVGGHHGRWANVDLNAHDAVDGLRTGGWDDQQQAHIDLVAGALGAGPIGLCALADDPGRTIILLSGLLVLADWIASDDGKVAGGMTLIASGLDPTSDATGWLSARDAEFRAHVEVTIPSVRSLDAATDTILGGRGPRPLQREALGFGPDDDGLWLVMYPTGEGKTEAALLRHVHRPNEQMIFALPTRATTNAMEKRLNKILGATGNAVYLSHQFAGSAPKSSGPCCDNLARSEWFTSSIRRLVAPFVAATCDQVLAAALRQRHSPLRLLALANHHVVIDEVHTFDEYQMSLLRELLAWLGSTRTRVTLLSATLPKKHAADLRNAYAAGVSGTKTKTLPYTTAYPSHSLLVPDRDLDLAGPLLPGPALDSAVPAIHTTVTRTADPVGAHVDWATSMAAAHPTSPIAVVVNTVDGAIDIARDLGRRVSTHDVWCLHSRMTLQHRNDIESRLGQRLGPDAWQDGSATTRPVIIVGTQVIEASLDIDVDFMSTALSPAPALIQRAGRLWRFGDSPQRRARTGGKRTLRVVAETSDAGELTSSGALPYPVSQLNRTLAFLEATPIIRVPEDVQDFVNDTHQPVSGAEFTAAAREVGMAAVKISAAIDSASRLADLLAEDKRLHWQHLAEFTNRHDAEELMRTRFIDQPGLTFLMLDSRAPTDRSQWALLGQTAASLRVAGPNQALAFVDGSIPVSEGLARRLYPAHLDTLAAVGLGSIWEPETRMLQGLLPLDLAHVAGCHYDDLTGLTKDKP